MNLLIRADASVAMGTGHVMRCLALAQAWQDAGGRAIFAMAESTDAIRSRLAAESCEVVQVLGTAGGLDDSSETVRLAAAHKARWVVVDGYQFGGRYQLALKEAGCKILFLDDNGHARHYSADLVLNQNAYPGEDLYCDRDSGTELLLGLPYAMLRREFRAWRDRKFDTRKNGGRVVVTLGGSDAGNLTPRVIAALEQLGPGTVEARVVAGGSNPNARELERAEATSRIDLCLLRNVTNMPELMAWADVAVSAAGTTVLELAFMGVPTILVTVADHQKPNALACERLGIAESMGDLVKLSSAQLAAAVSGLMADFERRRKMTLTARSLVDGRGADRVVARLMAASESKGGE